MISEIQHLRNNLEQRKGRASQLKDALVQSRRRVRELNVEVKHCEKSQAITQQVAQQTQQQLEYHVSEIVSLALSAVLPDPYKLAVEFSIRR